jgi:hypothetical protein
VVEPERYKTTTRQTRTGSPQDVDCVTTHHLMNTRRTLVPVCTSPNLSAGTRKKLQRSRAYPINKTHLLFLVQTACNASTLLTPCSGDVLSRLDLSGASFVVYKADPLEPGDLASRSISSSYLGAFERILRRRGASAMKLRRCGVSDMKLRRCVPMSVRR